MTTSYSSVNSLDEFTIIGGNDFTFSFSITEDGLPVNLTGSTLLLKIAPYGQPNNVITTITGSIGSTTDIAEFVLSSNTSEQMVGGKYMYQPVIQDTGGTIHRPKQGIFLLVQAIGAFSEVIEVPDAVYYIYGEGTNSYTSANTTITAYYAGLSIILYVQNTNSANSTLTLSGVVGTKNLMKFDSSGGKVVLVAGDLLINKKYLFVYDGSEWVLTSLSKSEIRSMLDPTYAPLASPALTGNPTAPTPSVGDNDTSIATTAFVNAEISNDRPYSDTNPVMDGTATQGVSAKISRQDHVHPSDTSRADVMTVSVGSVTTSNVSAVNQTRYFLDISGLTANRNFVLPASSAGKEIELSITSGDDLYELIIIGDTGVTINSGTSATEWSRLFITNEVVRFVATSSTNWQVIYDGRIRSKVVFHRITSDITTNSAGVETKADWNSSPINIGSLADLVNDRCVVRRSGYYECSAAYAPSVAISDQKYVAMRVYKNGTSGTIVGGSAMRQSTATSSRAVIAGVFSKMVSCNTDDYLEYYYTTEDANMGLLAYDTSVGISTGQTFFQVTEVF